VERKYTYGKKKKIPIIEPEEAEFRIKVKYW